MWLDLPFPRNRAPMLNLLWNIVLIFNLTYTQWDSDIWDLFITFYSRILIDTGEPNKPDYISLLQETLTSLKTRLNQVLITHWHYDHTGGVAEVYKMMGGNLLTFTDF